MISIFATFSQLYGTLVARDAKLVAVARDLHLTCTVLIYSIFLLTIGIMMCCPSIEKSSGELIMFKLYVFPLLVDNRDNYRDDCTDNSQLQQLPGRMYTRVLTWV